MLVTVVPAHQPQERDNLLYMLGLNQIRNDIAHRSRHKPLKIEVNKLRKATIGMSRKKKEVESLDIEKLVVYAALTCCGFLIMLTDELKKAQGERGRRRLGREGISRRRLFLQGRHRSPDISTSQVIFRHSPPTDNLLNDLDHHGVVGNKVRQACQYYSDDQHDQD